MLTVKIALSGNVFEFAGEATFLQLEPLITKFIDATAVDVDALASRLEGQNARLESAVNANTPTP
jgi:hypothetical protein